MLSRDNLLAILNDSDDEADGMPELMMQMNADEDTLIELHASCPDL